MRKPTIIDVARRAGVSIGTVSNVMNGTRAVSEDRREKVRQAIHDLGYLRNSLAQTLKSNHSRVVGVCVPSTASAYFIGLMEALEEIAARENFELLQVLSGHDPDNEYRRTETLLAHRIAGLIIVPSHHPQRTFELLDQTRTPVVMVDRLWPDQRFDYVTMNNRKAMTDTVEKLMAFGHRRILYIARYPNLVTTQQRIEAFRHSAGDGATVLLCDDDDDLLAERLASSLAGPYGSTAVIASNSIIGIRVLRALKSKKLSCPNDVSLVIFDDPLWADVMNPSLSVIRHPTSDIAEQAWDLLMERIQEMADGAPSRAEGRHIELPANIELRESVAAPSKFAAS